MLAPRSTVLSTSKNAAVRVDAGAEAGGSSGTVSAPATTLPSGPCSIMPTPYGPATRHTVTIVATNAAAGVTPARITLIGKPGCHLCDDARAVIARVAAELGVGWEERSIADDPDARARVLGADPGDPRGRRASTTTGGSTSAGCAPPWRLRQPRGTVRR